MAYERRLWQKLPINLFNNEVPVGFLQHIMKHGITYMSLDCARIIGDSVHFTQQKSLKYLILNIYRYGQGREVKKNLLASCTQLEKLSCRIIFKDDLDDIFQCMEQNSESLKCLELEGINISNSDDLLLTTAKFSIAINKCNKLEELCLYDWHFEMGKMDVIKNLPQNLQKVYLGPFKIDELKVLVGTCSQLEDLTLILNCCEDSICHHFDEVIAILVGSSLSDTLVNLSLCMRRINVHEEFVSKCLKLGRMKKLKILEIYSRNEEAKNILRKNLPHFTIVEDRGQENFFMPADPYAKHEPEQGFWEIGCNGFGLKK